MAMMRSPARMPALGGRTFDDGDDGDGFVAQIDFDAHADEPPLRVALKKTKVLR